MSYEAIARRYGRAIFEIGKETGTLAALAREIGDACATYAASEELRLVLDNPLVPEPAREAMLREIGARAGLSETATNTLRLLARRRRLAALPEIARQLARLVDRRAEPRPGRGDERGPAERRLPRPPQGRAREGDRQEDRHHPQAGSLAHRRRDHAHRRPGDRRQPAGPAVDASVRRCCGPEVDASRAPVTEAGRGVAAP